MTDEKITIKATVTEANFDESVAQLDSKLKNLLIKFEAKNTTFFEKALLKKKELLIKLVERKISSQAIFDEIKDLGFGGNVQILRKLIKQLKVENDAKNMNTKKKEKILGNISKNNTNMNTKLPEIE